MTVSIDNLIHYANDLGQHAIERGHYYVYRFASSYEAHQADHRIRAAFHDAHDECLFPQNLADVTHAHLDQMLSFLTKFRNKGRVLVVRTDCKPRAEDLMRVHLGEPAYRATLDPA